MEPSVTDDKLIHVLLVEDEYLISEWVAQSLSEQGFAVQTATNAADALGHLNSDQVDVLFTDINLPGDMDGAALARRAREPECWRWRRRREFLVRSWCRSPMSRVLSAA
jgi:CheY-like chemotaxis protein